jgi:hypothetical protein
MRHSQLWPTEALGEALQSAGTAVPFGERQRTSSPSPQGRPPAQSVDDTPQDGRGPSLSTDAPSGGASGSAGGAGPTLLALVGAAFAAMTQATRALVRPRSTSRSVTLVLVVERPG